MVTTPSTKLENLLRRVQPGKFASYQEYMRALQIEALGNSVFTFDQLNYDLYALNKELIQRLNKESTAFLSYWLTSNSASFLMDQLPHKINTEQSNRFEEILQQMDPLLVSIPDFVV